MSEYETDYRHRVNFAAKKVELVRWEGEDKVLLSLPFHKNRINGFTMDSAIEEIDKCIACLTGEDTNGNS